MGNKAHFFNRGRFGLPFIATFRTTTIDEVLELPYSSSLQYNGFIDWGDGTIVENTYSNRSHVYSIPGDYDVSIIGSIGNMTFWGEAARFQIKDLKQFGDQFYISSSFSFGGCSNLSITANDTPIITTTDFSFGFYACGNIIINNLENWDFSNVNTFTNTFNSTNVISQNNLSFWDLASAEGMVGTFAGSSSNAYLNISNMDVSNVKTMKQMFERASFNQTLNWNTSNVEDMSAMFDRSIAFNQDISNFDFSGLNSNGLTSSSRGFMGSKTFGNYDAVYYDNLLIKWAKDSSEGGLPVGMVGALNMGAIRYTSAGAVARQSILDNKGFTNIIDGGQI